MNKMLKNQILREKPKQFTQQDNEKARNITLSAGTYSVSFSIFVFRSNIIDVMWATVNFHYVQASVNNNAFSFVSAKQQLLLSYSNMKNVFLFTIEKFR